MSDRQSATQLLFQLLHLGIIIASFIRAVQFLSISRSIIYIILSFPRVFRESSIHQFLQGHESIFSNIKNNTTPSSTSSPHNRTKNVSQIRREIKALHSGRWRDYRWMVLRHRSNSELFLRRRPIKIRTFLSLSPSDLPIPCLPCEFN